MILFHLSARILAAAIAIMSVANCSSGQQPTASDEEVYLVNISSRLLLVESTELLHADFSQSKSTLTADSMSLDVVNERLYVAVSRYSDPKWIVELPHDECVFVFGLSPLNSVPRLVAQGIRPRVSPDGARVALLSPDTFELLVCNNDGSGSFRVTREVNLTLPSFVWVSDSEIAFFSKSKTMCIARVDGVKIDVETVAPNIVPDAVSPKVDSVLCYNSSNNDVFLYRIHDRKLMKLIDRIGAPFGGFIWNSQGDGFVYKETPVVSNNSDVPTLKYFHVPTRTITESSSAVRLFEGEYVPSELIDSLTTLLSNALPR